MKHIHIPLKYKLLLVFMAFLLFFSLSLFLTCTSTAEEKETTVVRRTPHRTAVPTPSPPKAENIGDVSLFKKYEPYFSIGAAVRPSYIKSHDKILKFHFNHLTIEDDMKFGGIHPKEDTYNFKSVDMICDYARENNMKLTGHTLVWHAQYAAWLFKGLKPGDKDDIELLKNRMKEHIETLINRYDDIVDNWDVVNEAISDSGGKTYRDNNEGSKWYDIFQNEDFIYFAFKYAQDALDAKDSKAKLFYNDYNTYNQAKLKKILNMARWLRDEKNVRIDGIGFQAHWNMSGPAVSDIKLAFDAIIKEGFLIKISELDVSVYTNDNWGQKDWEPEKKFDEQMAKQQAEYYKSIFALFREYSEHITDVTFWGVSDDDSWLDWFPTKRNNYPLLFDDDYNAKAAYYAIIDF